MEQHASLDVDYLILGAGATGIAFADMIINKSKLKVCMVDRQSRPGGHWTLAYDFVALHQPQGFQGVESIVLGDKNYPNHLATKHELLSQYETVMNKLKLSNKFHQYPSCEYISNGEFICLVTNYKYKVNFNKYVDSTYQNVTVPIMRPPKFDVENSVNFIPLNNLTEIHKYEFKINKQYVLGSGKTGIDAVLWLLYNRADPSSINWIMPNDAQFFNRNFLLSGKIYNYIKAIILQKDARSHADIYTIGEKVGFLKRIDSTVTPKRFKCATVNENELALIRSVNIIRQGRVKEVKSNKIVFNDNTIDINSNDLLIDCTACGIEAREAIPIQQKNKIILQPVTICQPIFSAAIIAYLDIIENDQEYKNSLLKPVQPPCQPNDLVENLTLTLNNNLNIFKHKKLNKWRDGSRLLLENHMPLIDKLKVLQNFKDLLKAAERLNMINDNKNIDEIAVIEHKNYYFAKGISLIGLISIALYSLNKYISR